MKQEDLQKIKQELINLANVIKEVLPEEIEEQQKTQKVVLKEQKPKRVLLRANEQIER